MCYLKLGMMPLLFEAGGEKLIIGIQDDGLSLSMQVLTNPRACYQPMVGPLPEGIGASSQVVAIGRAKNPTTGLDFYPPTR